MNEKLALMGQDALVAQTKDTLRQCNQITAGVGLSLSETQISTLATHRVRTLQHTGRIEFGEGILKKLVAKFLDSPYLYQRNYEETLSSLQETFYSLKNETNDRISDDELLDGMKVIFDGKAQGSLDYLAEVPLDLLLRAIQGNHDADMYQGYEWEDEDG